MAMTSAEKARAYRERHGAKTREEYVSSIPPAAHGTISGHRRHKKDGTEYCQPCRDAWAAYKRERRQAGIKA